MMRASLIAAVLLVSGAGLAVAGEVDGRAVVGGAVGGGLGAAAGSYLGGRTGAIVGSAVGAATGTAVATHKSDDEGLQDRETHRSVVYVAPGDTYRGKKQGKGCPPGLRMQGRC